MKIDIFAHIIPPKYAKAVKKLLPEGVEVKHIAKALALNPTLNDWDTRFRIMDKYPDYRQVLTLSQTHTTMFGKKAVELAKIANDEVSELIHKYPERFIAGVATLPMTDIDSTLKELDRAILDLHLKGVQLYASFERKPLDSAEYLPIYKRMVQYNLPIWIHPHRGPNVPDYSCEQESKYHIFSLFGWEYETTAAMARIVFSQILEQLPDLKFITHHAGGMVSFFADRIVNNFDLDTLRRGNPQQSLPEHPVKYFRMFYNDTATNGCTSSLECAYDFFGPRGLLFGTDMPFDCENGNLNIGSTIRAIQEMKIPDSDKKKIFEENALDLLLLKP